MNHLVVDVKNVMKELGNKEEFHRAVDLSPLEKDSERISFDGPVDVDLSLENTGFGVLVAGKVKGKLKISCSRCLCDFLLSAEFELSEVYAPDRPEEQKYRIVDNSIDLGPALDENFILEIPIAPLCDATCKGLCPVCGSNLNVSECRHEVERFDERLSELKEWFKKKEEGTNE
ncbi:MAG: DUF177 domain-containing protein [Actinobacteria bacterium]|nr:DUF177 domain-containing protein [Actinomycetota bacterium]